MTILPALGKFAPAQIQGSTPGSNEASLTQSRENGDVIPSTQLRGTTITKQEGRLAKPWAHFVAGGYIILWNSCPLKTRTDFMLELGE